MSQLRGSRVYCNFSLAVLMFTFHDNLEELLESFTITRISMLPCSKHA